jgi:flagellar assembly protein FliH
MRSPAKFLFDHDFASEAGGTISSADHADKVAQADSTGYARGFAAAQAAAKGDVDGRTIAALERIAVALEALQGSLSAIAARLEAEAVDVALSVARKLASALIAREPLAEMSALATRCFRHLVAPPHIVVRVNDALQAGARERFDEIVRARGFASHLVVLAEPEIAPGDCRIEWADGGIKRDRAAIEAAIDEAVTRYVAARTEAPAPAAMP